MTDTAISGATASTYVLGSADIGASVFCRIAGSNVAGSSSVDSNVLGPVIAAAAGPIKDRAGANILDRSGATISVR